MKGKKERGRGKREGRKHLVTLKLSLVTLKYSSLPAGVRAPPGVAAASSSPLPLLRGVAAAAASRAVPAAAPAATAASIALATAAAYSPAGGARGRLSGRVTYRLTRLPAVLLPRICASSMKTWGVNRRCEQGA